MLQLQRTHALADLHQAVLEISAHANADLDGDPYLTPYVGARWSPHISLAKVERSDQADAASIGRQYLRPGVFFTPRALELCDIGEGSERWDVLVSL